jgi:Peptidase family M28
MEFPDCRRALEYAVSLAFPRRVGSAGEEQAKKRLLHVLEKGGLSPWIEPVPLTGRGELLSRLIPWTSVALFSLCWAGRGLWLQGALTIALLPVLFSFLRRRMWLELGLRFPPRLHRGARATSNILAEVRGRESGAEPRVVWLLAHHDTKSYQLPISVRMAAAMALPLIGLVVAAAVLAGWGTRTYTWCVAVGVVAALLVSGGSGNESPGALDNAAALGVLLDLACHYRRNLPRTLVLRWVFTGAEEMGLLGAFALRHARGEELRRGTHLFVNLDGVGSVGSLRIFGPKKAQLTRAFLEASRKEAIPLRWSPLPPTMMMDHEVLATAGFPSVSLGCVGWELRHLHSRRDHPGLIQVESLRETGRLLRHVIDAIDAG